jgi:hypothetical protein
MRLVTLINLPVILLWLVVGVAAAPILDELLEEDLTYLCLSLFFSLRLVLIFCPNSTIVHGDARIDHWFLKFQVPVPGENPCVSGELNTDVV